MSDISKAFVNVWKSFRNVIRQFAQSNKNFVIIILLIVFGLIYKIAIADEKAIWVLAILNAFLCIVNYSKNKNLTETTLTLMIGLFTIFTVTWCNEFILIFISSILFFTILSFIISSVQISSKLESIITVAAGYWQNPNDFKTRYGILNEIAKKPTRNHQLSLEERALIVKEMIFDKQPLEAINDAKEIIEGFITILGFPIEEAIINYRMLNNVYIIQNAKPFRFSDMEMLFNFILIAPFGPKSYFDILKSAKKDLVENRISIEKLLQEIRNQSIKYRDIDIIISNIILA